MTHSHSFKTIINVDDISTFKGASIRTIARLMREVAKESGNTGWVVSPSYRGRNKKVNNAVKYSTRRCVSGIDLELVSDFDKISLVRKGWSVHMFVDSKTFHSSPSYVLLPIPGATAYHAVVLDTELKHFENFKNDMTKLMLFSDNWPPA